jgi:hypothetical protein
MRLPIGAYLDAAVPLLRTALTAAGYSNASKRVVAEAYQGIAYPYVLIDAGVTTMWKSKTSEGGEITPLFIVWATDHDEALTVADLVIATLTSRTSPPLPDDYALGPYGLDLAGGVLRQEIAGSTVKVAYGIPIRMRVMLMEVVS